MVSSVTLIFLVVSYTTVINCKPQSACAGVYCLPNPSNCQAVYPIGSCCPVWNCQNTNGGSFNSYGITKTLSSSFLVDCIHYWKFTGLSRVGGGPGYSFSQSSMSASSNNGGRPSSVSSFSSLNRNNGTTRSLDYSSTLIWFMSSLVMMFLLSWKVFFPRGAYDCSLHRKNLRR